MIRSIQRALFSGLNPLELRYCPKLRPLTSAQTCRPCFQRGTFALVAREVNDSGL
jgi:hypothetical protein